MPLQGDRKLPDDPNTDKGPIGPFWVPLGEVPLRPYGTGGYVGRWASHWALSVPRWVPVADFRTVGQSFILLNEALPVGGAELHPGE